MSARLDELLAVLDEGYEVRQELRRLVEFKRLMIEAQPLHEGDRAAIACDLRIPRDSGWFHYRESLVRGAPGTVTQVDYNHAHHYWYALFAPDACWSVSDWSKETKRYPKRPGVSFALPISKLRAATEHDVAPEMPIDEAAS